MFTFCCCHSPLTVPGAAGERRLAPRDCSHCPPAPSLSSQHEAKRAPTQASLPLGLGSSDPPRFQCHRPQGVLNALSLGAGRFSKGVTRHPSPQSAAKARGVDGQRPAAPNGPQRRTQTLPWLLPPLDCAPGVGEFAAPGSFRQWPCCGLPSGGHAVREVTPTTMAHGGWREGLVWPSVRSRRQQAQRSWLGTRAEACRDSLGVSWISRGWGTLSGPGAGDAVPESVLAPPPPQHFLIPAPNNNSAGRSHGDRPRPRPGAGPAGRHVTATPASLPPPLGVRRRRRAG